ncbi:hypothetical protein LOCC1_G006320 [Lachnellula occidentalis]|uniref:Gluconokinase n=1 Tax=Lachnellula occidentalis TaxID=215460 RepID=A0A8H8UGP8_9HELO|nr:hypothetical protein LOCC1_G006320 [Lachnellula occidentalis]
MRRAGFLSSANEPDRELEVEIPKRLDMNCVALITCSAMRKPARDAVRDIMLAHSIKTTFVIMHVTTETLSGRALGAEEPEMAKRIMGEKIADIEEPLEEEKDVILIDSIHDIDTSFFEILEGIRRQLAGF